MKDEGREMTVVDCKKITWSEHCFPHISPLPYFNHRDTFLCRGLSSDLQMSKCKLGQLNNQNLEGYEMQTLKGEPVRARQTFLYVL